MQVAAQRGLHEQAQTYNGQLQQYNGRLQDELQGSKATLRDAEVCSCTCASHAISHMQQAVSGLPVA